MRYHRTTGLMLSQMQELVYRVQVALINPWKSGSGRPKACGLYAAVEIACMYLPVTDPAMVGSAVAAALGVGEQQGRSIDDSVLAALADRRALLVLDNCEHLCDGVAPFVERLLARCPCVSVLTTSRARLLVPFEWVYSVPPLSLGCACWTARLYTFPIRCPVKRTTPGRSRRRRPRRSSGILAVVSLIKDIKAAEWSRRARSRSTASWLRRTSRWWRGLEVASHAVAPARRTEATHRLT